MCVASPYRVFLVAATACACLSITGRQASLNLEASLIGFSLLNKSNTRKPYQRGLPSVSHHFQSFACAYGYAHTVFARAIGDEHANRGCVSNTALPLALHYTSPFHSYAQRYTRHNLPNTLTHTVPATASCTSISLTGHCSKRRKVKRQKCPRAAIGKNAAPARGGCTLLWSMLRGG